MMKSTMISLLLKYEYDFSNTVGLHNIHILYAAVWGTNALALELQHKIIFKSITFYMDNILYILSHNITSHN